VDPPGTRTGVLALINGANALPEATTSETPEAPGETCAPCSVPTTTVPAGAITLAVALAEGGVVGSGVVELPPPPPQAVSIEAAANAAALRRRVDNMVLSPTRMWTIENDGIGNPTA